MDKAAYYQQIAPYVQRAAASTGIPAKTIAAQWAFESGHGSGQVASKQNNQAGIIRGGKFATYKNLDEFTADYIKAANLDRYNAARTTDPTKAIEALGAGGWDEAQYKGKTNEPGFLVKGLMKSDAALLAQFEANPSTTGAKPGSPSVWGRIVDFGQTIGEGAIEISGAGPASRAPEAIGGVVGGTVDAVGGAAEAVGGLVSTVTSGAWWRRIGIGAGGVGLILVGAGIYINSQRKR